MLNYPRTPPARTGPISVPKMLEYGFGLALLGVLILKFAALPKIESKTVELATFTPLQVVRGHLEHPEPSIAIGVLGIMAKTSAEREFLVVTQAGEQVRPRNNSAMGIPRGFFESHNYCIYLKGRLFQSASWNQENLEKQLTTRYHSYTWFEGIRVANADGSCPNGPFDPNNS